MGTLILLNMKRILVCLTLTFCFGLCFSQSSFNSAIINGDVKMTERFYDMALSYYMVALEQSTTSEEALLAQNKITECKNKIEEIIRKNSSDAVLKEAKVWFNDRYVETGEYKVGGSPDIYMIEGDYSLVLFNLAVYDKCLVILSTSKTGSEVDNTHEWDEAVIPFYQETKKYMRYRSEDGKLDFVIYKKADKNQYGTYHEAYRIEDDKYFLLSPTARIRAIKEEETRRFESESSSRDNSGQKAYADEQKQSEPNLTEPEAKSEEKVQTKIPRVAVSFTDNWFLNVDAFGRSIGDSRKDELMASEIVWLLLRLRYISEEQYERPIRFDIKVNDPKGNLIVLSENTISGYSAYRVVDIKKDGGIINIAFGKDVPGFFKPGRYTVSLWHNDEAYYYATIELK